MIHEFNIVETVDRPIVPKNIDMALAAYHPEFRYVVGFTKNMAEITLFLQNYPFTKNSMQYASVNLVNLGVEQAMIVHIDYEIENGIRKGFWMDINDYRRLVNNGHWLVPKLNTRIFRPVPINQAIGLKVEISKHKATDNQYILWFSAQCCGYFETSGVAFLLKSLDIE